LGRRRRWGNGRREQAAAAGGGRRWSSCSGAAGARLGARLGPVGVLGGGNHACVLGLVAGGGERGARRRASLENDGVRRRLGTRRAGGERWPYRRCAGREARRQLGQTGPRRYGGGQRPYHGGQGATAARRPRVRQRGFRDIPAIRGTLGHGQPGEHARRVGERAVRGPDAEARVASAGAERGAAWRSGALASGVLGLALFKWSFLQKLE
jgi:hypothetical protein